MGREWLETASSSRQLKCRHCRYSFSRINPLKGDAQPSARTCEAFHYE